MAIHYGQPRRSPRRHRADRPVGRARHAPPHRDGDGADEPARHVLKYRHRYWRETGYRSAPLAAADTRSAQDECCLLACWRNTGTSWRSTRISTSFERVLWASSPNQVTSCQKTRYSSRNCHGGQSFPTPLSTEPQISAVDDQSGTHTLDRRPDQHLAGGQGPPGTGLTTTMKH